MQGDDPWSVRILPRVMFGALSKEADGLSPTDPTIAVLHHFLGSWKLEKRRWWNDPALLDSIKAAAKRWMRGDDGSR